MTPLSPAGVVSTLATDAPGPNGFITRVAFSADGDFYTANNKTDVTSRITPAGAVSTFATLPADSHVAGMAFDQSGNPYTANEGTDTIGEISPAGLMSTFAVMPAGSGPEDVAFERRVFRAYCVLV